MPSLSRCVTDAFLWTTCTKKDPEEPFDRFDKPRGKKLAAIPGKSKAVPWARD